MKLKGAIRSIVDTARACDSPLRIRLSPNGAAFESLCDLGAEIESAVYRGAGGPDYVIDVAVLEAGRGSVECQNSPCRPATDAESSKLRERGRDCAGPSTFAADL
jgi:hypothetical protein